MLVRKFIRLGNSTAIVIPKPIAKLLNIDIGTRVEMVVEDGALILRPLPPDEEWDWRGKSRP